MSLIDEVLKEKRFPSENVNNSDRDLCIELVSFCKELTDSIYSVNGVSSFDLVEMHLKNSQNGIKFNGSISCDLENRLIDGIIDLKKLFVEMNVQRIDLDTNDKYCSFNTFKVKDEKLFRNTIYEDSYLEFNDVIENKEFGGKLR